MPDHRSRKWKLTLYLIALESATLIAGIVASFLELAESSTIMVQSFLALTATAGLYYGANVWQKKSDPPKP